MKIKLFTESLTMLPIALRLLAFSFLLLCGSVHAQAACPLGTIPYGAGNDLSICGPDNSQSQQPLQGQRSPASPPQRWADHWGAIATDATKGILGAATNLPSQSHAENAAMADCQSKQGTTCKVQLSYRNGCAAMMVGNKVFNTNVGTNLNEAIQKGLKMCAEGGDTNCRVYYSACSLPQRIQ